MRLAVAGLQAIGISYTVASLASALKSTSCGCGDKGSVKKIRASILPYAIMFSYTALKKVLVLKSLSRSFGEVKAADSVSVSIHFSKIPLMGFVVGSTKNG